MAFVGGSGAVDELGVGGGSPAGVLGLAVGGSPFGQSGAGVGKGAFQEALGISYSAIYELTNRGGYRAHEDRQQEVHLPRVPDGVQQGEHAPGILRLGRPVKVPGALWGRYYRSGLGPERTVCSCSPPSRKGALRYA